MNRVKVGFFSVSDRGESDDDVDDRAYLAWHQLDHMPEQYQLPGIVHGQRWVSNDACRAARLTGSGAFEHVHHVVLFQSGAVTISTAPDCSRDFKIKVYVKNVSGADLIVHKQGTITAVIPPAPAVM